MCNWSSLDMPPTNAFKIYSGYVGFSAAFKPACAPPYRSRKCAHPLHVGINFKAPDPTVKPKTTPPPQDILRHSDFRVEILGNVWRAFLFISESALKVAFKSEYLQLFQAQQVRVHVCLWFDLTQSGHRHTYIAGQHVSPRVSARVVVIYSLLSEPRDHVEPLMLR